MGDDEISLLKEIRDGLHQDFHWRRQVIEESMAFQRKAVKLQKLGLLIVGVLILGGAVGLLIVLR